MQGSVGQEPVLWRSVAEEPALQKSVGEEPVCRKLDEKSVAEKRCTAFTPNPIALLHETH